MESGTLSRRRRRRGLPWSRVVAPRRQRLFLDNIGGSCGCGCGHGGSFQCPWRHFFFFLMLFLWFWVLVFEVKKTVTQIKETRKTALIIMKQNWVKEVLLCFVLLDWYELKVYCLIFSGKVLRRRNKRAGSEGSVRLDFCRFFLVLLKALGHFAVFVIKFQEDFGLCLCLRFIERLGVD